MLAEILAIRQKKKIYNKSEKSTSSTDSRRHELITLSSVNALVDTWTGKS